MVELKKIEEEIKTNLKKNFPEFRPGDLVKVVYKIKEKDKERLVNLEGVVLKIQGEQHRKSFTLRRVAYDSAYEVTFPFYSPNIVSIEIDKKVKRQPRRKRLYYLREKIGKQALLA